MRHRVLYACALSGRAARHHSTVRVCLRAPLPIVARACHLQSVYQFRSTVLMHLPRFYCNPCSPIFEEIYSRTSDVGEEGGIGDFRVACLKGCLVECVRVWCARTSLVSYTVFWPAHDCARCARMRTHRLYNPRSHEGLCARKCARKCVRMHTMLSTACASCGLLSNYCRKIKTRQYSLICYFGTVSIFI